MAVAFGFSVGDCIAVCLLIKDVVKALDDSRGASTEYQEVIRELWLLDRALLEVEMLSRTYESTVELNALSCTAKRTAEQCRVCIERFLGTCKGYDKSLKQGGSGSMLRNIKGKVSWTVLRKDDLSKFRTEINAHASVLNMLLLTANLSLAKLNDKRLNDRLTSSEDQLNQKLDDNARRLEAQGSALTRLSSGMTYFLTLGTELKSLMNKIWTVSFGSYKILLDMQTRVPREFGPCWIQEPLTLTDALGRVAPIHLELVNSWEVWDAVLQSRFLNLPGEHKIKSGEYVISDGASEQDLVRSQAFLSAFLPGRRVDMSMLFRDQRSDNSCPGCGRESGSPDSTGATCSNCGIWFRRIEDLDAAPDVSMNIGLSKHSPSISKISNQHHEEPRIVQFVPAESSNTRSSAKRKLDLPQEAISSFKRVRLLQRRPQRQGPNDPSKPPIVPPSLAHWYKHNEGPWIPKGIADTDEDMTQSENADGELWYEGSDGPWVSKRAVSESTEEWFQPRIFDQASEAEKHDLYHSKPFICTVAGCPRTEGFSRRDNLERHIKSKHPMVIPETRLSEGFRCTMPECKSKKKPWVQLDTFRRHVKRVHGSHVRIDDDFDEFIRRGEYFERSGPFLQSKAIPAPIPTMGQETTAKTSSIMSLLNDE